MRGLSKIVIIASSLGLATGTTVIALPMLPDELKLPYIAFKIWMFGVVPIVFMYLTGKGKK